MRGYQKTEERKGTMNKRGILREKDDREREDGRITSK